MRIRRAAGVIAAGLCALLIAGPPVRAGDTYSDPAYREHDLDNLSRSSARQRGMFTDTEYGRVFFFTAAETWLTAQANQVGDLRAGRLHTGLGQLLPGGAVGDPRAYHEITPQRIQFLSRTGAKLSGRIWGSDGTGAKPGVVITTGSIQGTEHMYWWAARTLARAGYVVMTWDVQGQGESETSGHAFGSPAPTGDGVPSQQNANFDDGTIDALRFFLSTPDAQYRPLPRTEAEVSAAKAAATESGEHLDWVNPAWGVLDRTRLGLAGHSLGASAVSKVQQCSDQGSMWSSLPLCQGTSFPIRAVVGWDSLSAAVTPVVPGMNQQADGYFLNPTPATSAPDSQATLAAQRRWHEAALDTFTVVVRGGTHLEWTEVPYILPATAYGTKLADYYTLAWIDRYVKGDPSATQRLLDGVTAMTNSPEAGDVAWNAHHMSTRRRSGFSLAGVGSTTDLRAWASLSPVGDWAGSNADRVGRELP